MMRSAINGRKAAFYRTGMLASAATIALAVPHAAFAQTEPQASEAAAPLGNEIIVTARKANETLQEVPVTVSVVDRKTLDDYHVNHVEDVASRVPTLNVQIGGSGSGGQLSLRGVGSSNISAAFDSAVAFDFDGVQISTMRLVQAGFFDVGQVEVLKGPQSLYFGKSATAGVLSLKSAEPTRTWEAAAKASYEFEEKGKVVGGYVSGPLGDDLGIRLAAQYTDIDRFQRLQVGTPAVKNPRTLKDIVGRLTLNWQPQDRFTANLKVQYVHTENDGAIAQSDIYCGANGRADEIYLLQGAVAFPAGYDCKTNNGRYYLTDTNPALAKSVPNFSRAQGYNGVPFGETDLYFARMRFDLDMSDTIKLTSISGFVDLNAIDVDNYSYGGIGPAFSPVGNLLGRPLSAFAPALAAINGPGVPGGVGTSDPVNKLRQYTQELRLASNFDGPINFLVGAFYENRRFVFNTAQQAVNISLIAPDPVTGYTFDYRKIQVTKTDAYSAFGSLTFTPTDQLEISGGVRYTKEDKTNTISIPYVHSILSAGAFVKSGFFSGPIEFHDTNFSPEATVKYKVTPTINVFASVKTGYKSGGVDNSALPSNSLLGFASPDPLVQAATARSLVFKSEKAKGGEIGFKSEFAGRTLTLNGTAYYYVFKDLQVQSFNATTVQFVTQNAGEVTTKGVDLEMRWRTPLEGLNLSTNLSFLNGKFTKDFFNPGPDGKSGTADDINLNGRKVARAPNLSGNVGFDWTAPVGEDLSLGLSGNMTYSGKYFTNNSTLSDYVQKSWTTFDARVSFGQRDDRWRVAVVGVNLADKLYTNTSGGRPFLAPANPYGVPVGDDQILTQNRGRQIFVEASMKF
ncbi:TonB-dependent receptor [Novosphingobium tardum]|uniref:TonB-dependent receptor n=1 Tax=Novosphingobium tardum TaxID=1538021 RepID=A0ABV8RR27_9SPHN